jgi:hypothetical protein
MALIHIQNIAPGPPIAIARPVPANVPTPTLADNAISKVAIGVKVGFNSESSSDFIIFLNLNCGAMAYMVKKILTVNNSGIVKYDQIIFSKIFIKLTPFALKLGLIEYNIRFHLIITQKPPITEINNLYKFDKT